MYAKKIVFSAFTAPALVWMHQSAEYQNRRGSEKRVEAARREKLLSQEPVDITPPNKGHFAWSEQPDKLDKFENDWAMKPVVVKGIFDHTREVQVEKMRNGEKGADIITPFYTHLDNNGVEQGIIVNRGWVPYDLRESRMHYNNSSFGAIRGVLYRGDAKTKYWQPNNPTIKQYTSVQPHDCSLIM